MLHIELKFLSFIRSQLEGFTQKKDNVYNFRCPICGDSLKNKRKKRGYIYPWKNGLFFTCKNCGESHSFPRFLEKISSGLYQELRIELFREKYATGRKETKNDVVFDIDLPSPSAIAAAIGEEQDAISEQSSMELFESLVVPVNSLAVNHPARKYVDSRMIPGFQHKHIYYAEHMKAFEAFDGVDIDVDEPRIAIPVCDRDGDLVGIVCRSLAKNASLRYINVKIKDKTMIFGLDRVDPTSTIYVVEGPIDSLFLPNSIAVIGLSFSKVRELLSEYKLAKDQLVIVIDNQPRNKDVCKILSRLIDDGFNVVIWPIDESLGKDINELIKDSGVSPRDVFRAINSGTCRGIEARLRFSKWVKCRFK